MAAAAEGFEKKAMRLGKGTPLSVHRLRHESLLKRVAFCVHIVRPCLVFVDVRLKAEHDGKEKKEAEDDRGERVPEHDGNA